MYIHIYIFTIVLFLHIFVYIDKNVNKKLCKIMKNLLKVSSLSIRDNKTVRLKKVSTIIYKLYTMNNL